MPFKILKNNAVIWEDPEPVRKEIFTKKLQEASKEKDEVTLPESIQAQLNTFMASTLNGVQRLANSNNTINKSINNVAKFGLQPVDIIIPVYGNLHVVMPCIKSVFERTEWPFRLTIVDDCSPDSATKPALKALEKQGVQVLFNNKNKGFSATVNRGILNTNNPYICILNSDVLVTPGWLTKMVLALEANPRNKIVNPITNNTALIDVPMQEGFSYLDMNKAFESTSSHIYPEIMPTGFCYMFKRDLINSVGLFDEGFESYGEETDHWMKTISHVVNGEYPRWRAVLADDTYLFHERGTSFSSLGNEKHMSKRQAGSARFHSIWPNFKQWQKGFDVKKVMSPYRASLPVLPNTSLFNLAFIVHSTSYCGGMKYITDIVNNYIEQGINAKVVLLKRKPDEKPPTTLGELRTSPVIFNSKEDFIENFKTKVFDTGILIAGTCELVPPIHELCSQINSKFRSVLLAQSDDPELTPDQEMKNKLLESYKKVDYIISGSSWLDEKIKKIYNCQTLGYIQPGIDYNLFHPGDRTKGDERPTVLFSLLDQYPYKGFSRGVETAKELLRLCKAGSKEIRVMAYGPLSIPGCPDIIGLGGINQAHLANILRTEIDIFCDPSLIHSYGLPSLEAMACGVVPVCWDNKGINEYTNKENSIVFSNDASPQAVAFKMFNLLFDENPEMLQKLKANAIKVRQDRNESIQLFSNILENNLGLRNKPKKISVITPHLRKHGGPTTILAMANALKKRGHDVSIYTVYSDINPEVVGMSDVPVHVDWKRIPKCDILITNSDNDKNNFFSICPAKKKIMLKLSHNMRFQQLEDEGLKYPWDAIVTSTQWLADICEKPNKEEGWTYEPRKATRIGWFHYGHQTFACPPNMRKYGSLATKIRIGFLAHQHPLKGTKEALYALQAIKQKYQDKVEIVAVGEWPQFAQDKPNWIGYAFSPNREQLADLLKQTDIWLTSSFTEGLGRMALEAMSASCAVVMTDTGAEFAEKDKNCLIVGKGNSGQMSVSIDKLINDQLLFSEIVKNGFETACRFADSTEYINKLEEVIKNV